jgi:hypothetical protein
MTTGVEGDTIKEEYALIAAGSHFWCETHLSAIPVADQSRDSRYCRVCCNFLTEEAKMLPPTRRPSWRPKAAPTAILPPSQPVGGAQRGYDNGCGYPAKGYQESTGILSTVTKAKRGRKRQDLPNKQILALRKQGLGSKRIAGELARQGIMVNYRTIARMTA